MTYTIIFTNVSKVLCKIMLYLCVCILEDVPDNNENLIDGTLEQSTDHNLINFLTTAKSDDFLEENYITSENEDIFEIPIPDNVIDKSTQNGTYFILLITYDL